MPPERAWLLKETLVVRCPPFGPDSTHLLLQVRISVLDGRLRKDFARWYPGFAANDSALQASA